MDFYHSYGYTTDIIGGILIFLSTWSIVILIASSVLYIANWKIYIKMGRKGWEGIVPIYNKILALGIFKLPIWLIILMFIPGAIIGLNIVIAMKMAERFGKPTEFALGLIFLPIIFYPILAFDKSEFEQ